MKCTDVRSLFLSYMDGVLTGCQMQSLAEHLDHCAECNREYAQLRQTQQMVAALGRKQPPADLALKLRVALSQEAALRRERLWNRWSTSLEDTLNGFMLPAATGLVSAVVFFCVMIVAPSATIAGSPPV